MGGRPPRLLTDDDEEFVVQTATTRPTKLGKPFTRWSVRKLADHLRRNTARPIRIGREALRCLLARRGVTFQRTKTWKKSTAPDFGARLDRIEYALTGRPDRAFAFDEFGRSASVPPPGPAGRRRVRRTGCQQSSTGPTGSPVSTVATRSATTPSGASTAATKAPPPSLAALQSIRAARPGGAPIYVILDNLSSHKGSKIRRWARKNKVELCFTPTNASWANRIEAHFGPLRRFTLANSHHANHTVQTRELQRHLRWRDQNARHPDVLAAQRRERARVRSERGIRWGDRPQAAAIRQGATAVCPTVSSGERRVIFSLASVSTGSRHRSSRGRGVGVNRPSRWNLLVTQGQDLMLRECPSMISRFLIGGMCAE